MGNLGHGSPRISPPASESRIGTARGLHLLRMIHNLTLEAIPQVIKITDRVLDSSDWHELKVLASHFSVLISQRRLKRLTITASAILQLQLAHYEAEMRSEGVDQVEMRFGITHPISRDVEFAYSPQSAFPLRTLIDFHQPLHVITQYPLSWCQILQPDYLPPSQLPPLAIDRPYEAILTDALEALMGRDTTVCAHDLHDQCPPIGHIGAQHHVSFIAFPSVPVSPDPSRDILPYIRFHVRLLQINHIIRRSNPSPLHISNCHLGSHQPTSLAQWGASTTGTWTFYRVGAMIDNIVPSSEFVEGDDIEMKTRTWVQNEYAEERGHPKGFADSINARMRFVHGNEDVDPDALECEGCGHSCRVPVD